MKNLIYLLISFNAFADDGLINPDPFNGEIIESYSSEYNPIEQHYSGTTESGKTITGTHSDIGGFTTDTWTTRDAEGNTNSTYCTSYAGSTFCY